MDLNISKRPDKTTINFRDKSFIRKIIEGTENDPKDVWEALQEMDLGLEVEPVIPVGIESLSLKNMFLFIFAASPKKFKAEFMKHGINIDQPHDLEIIISLAEQGRDKELNMNFTDMVRGICLTQEEVSSALEEIKFSFGC